MGEDLAAPDNLFYRMQGIPANHVDMPGFASQANECYQSLLRAIQQTVPCAQWVQGREAYDQNGRIAHWEEAIGLTQKAMELEQSPFPYDRKGKHLFVLITLIPTLVK